MKIVHSDITAIILAGGQGRRMGGQDKGLLEHNGQKLIDILLAQLKPEKVDILINANRNQDIYETYGFPVISDQLSDFQGPLAGFSSAMAAVDTRYILTLPCDSPVLASGFIDRFIAAQHESGAQICVAHDGERLQPVYALVDTRLLASLNAYLTRGERKIDRWYAQHDFARVDFSDEIAMFQNINTPEDQQRLIKRST